MRLVWSLVVGGLVVAERFYHNLDHSPWQIVSLCEHSFSLKNHVSEDDDDYLMNVEGD